MPKTIGILGAGPSARMLVQTGRGMGLDFIILDPATTVYATGLAQHIRAGWDDDTALAELAQRSDIVTFSFENVPAAPVRAVASHCPVYPLPGVLSICRDRLREKELLRSLGIPVTPFQPVGSRPDLLAAVEQLGLPCLLKTRRRGIDGSGQAILRFQEDLERAWQVLGDLDLVCEHFVRFVAECSISAARGADGQIVCWPLTRNLHRDGRLVISKTPAFAHDLQSQAEDHVRHLLEHLAYRGVLTLEFFLHEGRLLAHTISPGLHETVHWSLHGAATSQFENHLRAVCGMSLGDTSMTAQVVMFKLVGETTDVAVGRGDCPAGVYWHDGQESAHPEQDAGHVTVTAGSESGLMAKAAQVAGLLGVAAELNLEAIFS